MSRAWAGWNTFNLGRVGNWGLRGNELESLLPPFLINGCILILLYSLSLRVVLLPLFLSSLFLSLSSPFSPSVISFHCGLCLEIGLDINSHQRSVLPKGEERKVLSAPGFGEDPSGEGPWGQASTCPGKGLWILLKCGSQAPEGEEEARSRVRAPPLTIQAQTLLKRKHPRTLREWSEEGGCRHHLGVFHWGVSSFVISQVDPVY